VTIRSEEDAGRGSSFVTVQMPGIPRGRVGVGVGWSIQMPNGNHYRAGRELIAAVDTDISDDEREALRKTLRARAESEVAAELDSLDEQEFEAGDRTRHLVEDELYPVLIDDIDAAQHSVLLTSPFSGKRMDQLIDPLTRAAERGIEVVVLTKPENDTATGSTEKFANWQTPRHWDPLRAAGVKIEYRGDNMHEKITTVDNGVAYIGSQNVTSHKDTTELTLRLESQAVASALATKYHPETGLAQAEREERTIDGLEGGLSTVSGIRWSSAAPDPGAPPSGLFGDD
jgi:phosphatidylserine/phosphatidylglycerophosphate/cardiolipin synthase-like enzyme